MIHLLTPLAPKMGRNGQNDRFWAPQTPRILKNLWDLKIEDFIPRKCMIMHKIANKVEKITVYWLLFENTKVTHFSKSRFWSDTTLSGSPSIRSLISLVFLYLGITDFRLNPNCNEMNLLQNFGTMGQHFHRNWGPSNANFFLEPVG